MSRLNTSNGSTSPNSPRSAQSLLSVLRSHRRLYGSFALGGFAAILSWYFGMASGISLFIVAYDVTAGIYILWALSSMFGVSESKIRERALVQDDGKFVALFLVVISLLAALTVIIVDLASVREMGGKVSSERLLVALWSITLSWCFTHVVFALHYAHEFYVELARVGRGGLEFAPTSENPDYFDFLYFSFVIGATAQTSDVVVSSKKLRRIVLLHSILAFFFNTSLLALAVNIASSLI